MQHREQPPHHTRDPPVTGGFTQTDTTRPDPVPAPTPHTVTDTALLTRDSYHTASGQLQQHLMNMALGLDTLHHDEPVIPGHTDHKSQVTPQVGTDHSLFSVSMFLVMYAQDNKSSELLQGVSLNCNSLTELPQLMSRKWEMIPHQT